MATDRPFHRLRREWIDLIGPRYDTIPQSSDTQLLTFAGSLTHLHSHRDSLHGCCKVESVLRHRPICNSPYLENCRFLFLGLSVARSPCKRKGNEMSISYSKKIGTTRRAIHQSKRAQHKKTLCKLCVCLFVYTRPQSAIRDPLSQFTTPPVGTPIGLCRIL